MTIAVRYFSKTGNTEKVAKLIAEQLNVEAHSVDTPLDGPVDDLFLGGAIHMASVDRELKDFVAKLDSEQVGQVFMFGTSGGVMSIGRGLTSALKAQHVKIAKDQLFLHGLMPSKKALSDEEKAKIAAFVQRVGKETITAH